MSLQAEDDFFGALSTRSIDAEIDRRIYLTENNKELSVLGALLIHRALDILMLMTPAETLKSAINELIDGKGDKYNELQKVLNKFTSEPDVIK